MNTFFHYVMLDLFISGPSSVNIPVDSENKHMGHGIVTFEEKELAQLAYQELKKSALKTEMIFYTGPANRDPPEVINKI